MNIIYDQISHPAQRSKSKEISCFAWVSFCDLCVLLVPATAPRWLLPFQLPELFAASPLMTGNANGKLVVTPEWDKDDSRIEDDVEARFNQRTPEPERQAPPGLETILRLNVGGMSYRIRTRSIMKFGPKTLLGRFLKLDHEHRKTWADHYFEEEKEYFFERVPRYFDPIYDFYATGKLHVPKDLCFDKFIAETKFWAVSRSHLDECCSPFGYLMAVNGEHAQLAESEEDKEFVGLCCSDFRRRLWRMLEGQTQSKWWKAFEIVSVSFVLLSILALILGSIPEFQVPHKDENGDPVFVTASTPTYLSEKEEPRKQEMTEHPIFSWIENICVIYFSIEYAVRFLIAPKKLYFVRQPLNIIDLLSIAPFYVELLFWICGISGENVRKVRWAFLTVRLLRVLRVIRIAKLGRFSPGLANFALTLRRSSKQLQMVGVVLLTVIVFFSTLIYFLEKDEPNTNFISIPATFWWCVVSMTTVGYGDLVPSTVLGKLFGTGAIVSGIMVLALPITIMVTNFMQVLKLQEQKVVRKMSNPMKSP